MNIINYNMTYNKISLLLSLSSYNLKKVNEQHCHQTVVPTIRMGLCREKKDESL